MRMGKGPTAPAENKSVMKAVLLRAASLALLAALLLAGGAAAQEATPVASPTAVDPAACTVAPRSEEELRTLIPAGFRIAVGAITDTPAAGDGATPAADDATPAATPPAGEPADAATVAAVTDVVGQYAACLSAGNVPAIAAILTENGASTFLGFGVATFTQVTTGTRLTPGAELDPALVDAYIAALAFPVAPPAEFRPTSYEVREVTRLDDGRVLATVSLATGTEVPSLDRLRLREEDGRYRVVFGPDEEERTAGTPVAATPAVATPVR